MPSARLICLSFIGQSGPQGKVSWFSHPCKKAHALLRAEVPYSGPPSHKMGGQVQGYLRLGGSVTSSSSQTNALEQTQLGFGFRQLEGFPQVS